MDDRQFDTLARTFARRRSRRALGRGLLGGVVGLLAARFGSPGAAAREGYSLQGGPCVDDLQCLFADTPLFCAYNGHGSAGAACCAPSGGRCFDNADCCGPATCYSGRCFDLSAPAVGEACWQLSGEPDPCFGDAVCVHDWQSGGIWGTCQALDNGLDGDPGELCGDRFCEPWQRCCSQCSGICAPRDGVCPDGQCRSGYDCPDDCGPDSPCPGCLSGYCLYDGACAYLAG